MAALKWFDWHLIFTAMAHPVSMEKGKHQISWKSASVTQWKIYSAVNMPDTFGKQLRFDFRNIVWINRGRFIMLKVRLQGTKRDINWFRKCVEQSMEIIVLQFSEPFSNKGTTNYFRVYGEVEKNES